MTASPPSPPVHYASRNKRRGRPLADDPRTGRIDPLQPGLSNYPRPVSSSCPCIFDFVHLHSTPTDEIVAVIATTHPWARRRALSPRDLLNEPYLTREAASGTRAVATAALASVGFELRPVLQAASAQSLKRALEDGGFTLISRITIEAEQRAGTLSGIPIRGLDLKRELKAIRRRRPAPTGPARALWRWLADVAASPAGIDK